MTANYQFSNNAQSTLAAAVSAGETSLTIASPAPFPTNGDFTILIDSEIMLVTGVVGSVFTVARAQEGTSAAAHASGATVQLVVTAAFLNALSTGVAGSSFPASPNDGARFFRTDRGIEYFWSSSVGRWLSTTLHVMPGPLAENYTTAGSGVLQLSGRAVEGGQDLYIVSMTNVASVLTTNDGSNYWSVTLYKHDGTTSTSVMPFTTASYAPGTYNRWTNPINTLIPASSILQLFTLVTPTGSPGPLYLYGSKIDYRLAG